MKPSADPRRLHHRRELLRQLVGSLSINEATALHAAFTGMLAEKAGRRWPSIRQEIIKALQDNAEGKL